MAQVFNTFGPDMIRGKDGDAMNIFQVFLDGYQILF